MTFKETVGYELRYIRDVWDERPELSENAKGWWLRILLVAVWVFLTLIDSRYWYQSQSLKPR
jgi:hypothetical protein